MAVIYQNKNLKSDNMARSASKILFDQEDWRMVFDRGLAGSRANLTELLA